MRFPSTPAHDLFDVVTNDRFTDSPVPLFSKTRKGGDLQILFSCLAMKVTLFKTDAGGFREGRGESVMLHCHIHIAPNRNWV
jgi:hypothetical protein